MTQIILVFSVLFSALYTVTATLEPQTPTLTFLTTPQTIEVKSSTLLGCQISSFDFSSPLINFGYVEYLAKFKNVNNKPSDKSYPLAMYYHFVKQKNLQKFVSLAPAGVTIENTTDLGLKSNFAVRLTLSSDQFAGDYWCSFSYFYENANGKGHLSNKFNSSIKSTTADSFEVDFSAGKQEVVTVSQKSPLTASCTLTKTTSNWEVVKVSFLIWEYAHENKSHSIAHYTRVPSAQLPKFTFTADNSTLLEVTSDSKFEINIAANEFSVNLRAQMKYINLLGICQVTVQRKSDSVQRDYYSNQLQFKTASRGQWSTVSSSIMIVFFLIVMTTFSV